MYGFLAMLYNLICGSAAASDSVSKYQQSQRNLKEAIDRGDKVYEDAKGRMKTIGGDPAMEWFDERGRRVIINRANGRVIRDFDEELAEERKQWRRESNEKIRMEAMANKKKYCLFFPVEWPERKVRHEETIKDEQDIYWRVSNYYIECETKLPYQLEYSYQAYPGLKPNFMGKYDNYYYFYFYKQYFNDESCKQLGKRIVLTREEWIYWGGRIHRIDDYHHRYYGLLEVKNPYNIDVEKERRNINKSPSVQKIAKENI